MGFSELKTLENKLSQLKKDLSTYQDKLKTQKKRAEDVKIISTKISEVSSNGASDVSQEIRTMKSELEQAMEGVKSEATLTAKATSDLEQDCSADSDLNEAKAKIDSEYQDVLNNIQDLETKISTTQSSIADTEERIRSERRSIAASFKASLDQAVRKLLRLEEAVKQDPANAELQRQYEEAKVEKNSAQANYNTYSGWL